MRRLAGGGNNGDRKTGNSLGGTGATGRKWEYGIGVTAFEFLAEALRDKGGGVWCKPHFTAPPAMTGLGRFSSGLRKERA